MMTIAIAITITITIIVIVRSHLGSSNFGPRLKFDMCHVARYCIHSC